MPTKPNRDQLGFLRFTATIDEWIQDRSDILAGIAQRIDLFTNGDWGDLDEEDWQSNLDTIKSPQPGGRLMGAYKLFDGRRIWIITDGYGNSHLGPDCCYTTVLSPDDY